MINGKKLHYDKREKIALGKMQWLVKDFCSEWNASSSEAAGCFAGNTRFIAPVPVLKAQMAPNDSHP